MIYVNNIYQTIQGEGVKTGIPMLLLRLQGCDVGCPFCDTKETWAMPDPDNEHPLGYYEISPEKLVAKIKSQYPNTRWIMITGGEPAIQDLTELTERMKAAGYKIAIETSGTEPLRGSFDWVTVSPKHDMPNKKPIIPETIQRADELKFVVGVKKDLKRAETFIETYPTKNEVVFCLQPMSNQKHAVKMCIAKCMERSAFRLSVQVHKLLYIA